MIYYYSGEGFMKRIVQKLQNFFVIIFIALFFCAQVQDSLLAAARGPEGRDSEPTRRLVFDHVSRAAAPRTGQAASPAAPSDAKREAKNLDDLLQESSEQGSDEFEDSIQDMQNQAIKKRLCLVVRDFLHDAQKAQINFTHSKIKRTLSKNQKSIYRSSYAKLVRNNLARTVCAVIDETDFIGGVQNSVGQLAFASFSVKIKTIFTQLHQQHLAESCIKLLRAACIVPACSDEKRTRVTGESPKTPERPKKSPNLSYGTPQRDINVTSMGPSMVRSSRFALPAPAKRAISGDFESDSDPDFDPISDRKRSVPSAAAAPVSPARPVYCTPPSTPVKPFVTPPRPALTFSSSIALTECFIKNSIRLGGFSSAAMPSTVKSFYSLITIMFEPDRHCLKLRSFSKDGFVHRIILAFIFKNLDVFIKQARSGATPDETVAKIFEEDLKSLDTKIFKGQDIERFDKMLKSAKPGDLHKDLKKIITAMCNVQEGPFADIVLLSLFEYYYHNKCGIAPLDNSPITLWDALENLNLLYLIHADNICALDQTHRNARRAVSAAADGDIDDCAVFMAALNIQRDNQDKLSDWCKAKPDESPTKGRFLAALTGEEQRCYDDFKTYEKSYLFCENIHSNVRYYKQAHVDMIRTAMQCEIDLKIPEDTCILSHACIVSSDHIFKPTLDCEDKDATTGIKGGHFSPDVPCPFAVCVPAWLINDPRNFSDKIIAFDDNVPNPKKGFSYSTDPAIRSGVWTIQYDSKNPLYKAQKSGNGTRKEMKTLFPDCFKQSFTHYVKDLYELVDRLNRENLCKLVITGPISKSTILLQESRQIADNIETSVYRIEHSHYFGCRDENCEHFETNGKVCVTMYVRRERLSPHHTLTTITSMHPVD